MRRRHHLRDLGVEYPTAVLGSTALLSAVLACGLLQIQIDSSVESLIVQGSRDQRAFDERKATFGSDDVVAFAIPFADALAADALASVRRIALTMESLPAVLEVDSVATTDDIIGTVDGLEVGPVIPADRDPERLTPGELTRVRERVARNRIWSRLLISDDARVAGLQVRLDPEATTPENAAEVMGELERVVQREIGERPYYLAGVPFMKVEIATTMQRDFAVFAVVTVLVMMVLLIVGLGSWQLATLVFGSILLCVVWMLGAMGWTGQPITALSNAGPTILLALGTAYFMHLAAAYQREARAGGAPRETVARALDHVRRPLVIAGVTTAIGFGSLGVSQVPLVRSFGGAIALGILGVVLIGCFSLPAALTLLRPPAAGGALLHGERLSRLLQLAAKATASHAGLLFASAVVLLLFCFWIATARLEIDSSGPGAFAEDSRYRVSSAFYREHLSGDFVHNVYLSAPPDGFKDPDRLRRMLALQADAESLPEIDKTLSIANYITFMNRAFHGDRPEEDRVPETAEAVAQFLLLYSMSGDPDEFDDIVSTDYSQARIVLKATVPTSRTSARLRARLTELVERYFPGQGNPDAVLSTEILLSAASDALAREQLRSFAGALVAILLIVALAFRSARAGVLMVLPNTMPIALNLCIMALAGIALSQATSVIAVIALGIAVDSSVHLLAEVQRLEGEAWPRHEAVRQALRTTGRPIVVTSVIVVAGFSVLMLSDFKIIAEFGMFTALTILFCLIADLLVLPAQLLLSRAPLPLPRPEAPGTPRLLARPGGTHGRETSA